MEDTCAQRCPQSKDAAHRAMKQTPCTLTPPLRSAPLRSPPNDRSAIGAEAFTFTCAAAEPEVSDVLLCQHRPATSHSLTSHTVSAPRLTCVPWQMPHSASPHWILRVGESAPSCKREPLGSPSHKRASAARTGLNCTAHLRLAFVGDRRCARLARWQLWVLLDPQ